jgi:uncharacterized membrane protein
MRTTASVGGHPVHMMVVQFPMAFLMGSAAFDVATAVGLAVAAVVAGYLLVAGLATGILAAAPVAVDFVTTVRHAESSRLTLFSWAGSSRRVLERQTSAARVTSCPSSRSG